MHAGQLRQRVPGGIGRYVRHLLDHLPEVGVDPVPFSGGRLTYQSWQWIRRPRVRAEGDLVHAPSLAVPAPGRRPLVVTVHDLVFERFPEYLTPHGVRFHRRGLAVTSREAAAVVAPSAFVRDELLEHGMSPDRVFVAHHGVAPPPPLDGVTPGAAGPPFALFVGTVEPRKGLDTLLDAVAALRASGHPELTLVVAGAHGWGDLPDLQQPWVDWRRDVDDRTLDALYAQAVALALPSRYEGFGLPVVEAMAHGCPVVTSTAACLPEIAGDAGLLVPPDDVDALAGALAALLDDEPARAALAARGRERADRFTWRASAEAHRTAYEHATGTGG